MGIGDDEVVLTLWCFSEAPVEFRELLSESSGAWVAQVSPKFADRSIESLVADWGMSFKPSGQSVLANGAVIYVGEFQIKTQPKLTGASGFSLSQL